MCSSFIFKFYYDSQKIGQKVLCLRLKWWRMKYLIMVRILILTLKILPLHLTNLAHHSFHHISMQVIRPSPMGDSLQVLQRTNYTFSYFYHWSVPSWKTIACWSNFSGLVFDKRLCVLMGPTKNSKLNCTIGDALTLHIIFCYLFNYMFWIFFRNVPLIFWTISSNSFLSMWFSR